MCVSWGRALCLEERAAGRKRHVRVWKTMPTKHGAKPVPSFLHSLNRSILFIMVNHEGFWLKSSAPGKHRAHPPKQGIEPSTHTLARTCPARTQTRKNSKYLLPGVDSFLNGLLFFLHQIPESSSPRVEEECWHFTLSHVRPISAPCKRGAMSFC